MNQSWATIDTQNRGDILARVLPADGTLVVGEFDVATPVEAAGADLPLGRRGEVDAPGAQQGQVQRPGATGSGGVSPAGTTNWRQRAGSSATPGTKTCDCRGSRRLQRAAPRAGMADGGCQGWRSARSVSGTSGPGIGEHRASSGYTAGKTIR